MTKLPGLITAYAPFDDRDRPSIEHVARIIREAGYIPTTKRGSGAADMTSREAVNLFLGLNGGDNAREATVAIDRFRSLRRQYVEPADPRSDVLKSIATADTFGEALEALIDGSPELMREGEAILKAGYPDGNLASVHIGYFLNPQSDLSTFKSEVVLLRYSASITCRLLVGDGKSKGSWTNTFQANFVQDANLVLNGFYGTGAADRLVSVTFTHRTFFALWRALNGVQK